MRLQDIYVIDPIQRFPFVSLLDWTTSVANRCAVSRAAIAPTRLSGFTRSWDPPWHSTASVSIVCMGTEHCELVQNRME